VTNKSYHKRVDDKITATAHAFHIQKIVERSNLKVRWCGIINLENR
jgi:hypothetical protein